MKKRLIALLLSVVTLMSLVVPGVAAADDTGLVVTPASATLPKGGSTELSASALPEGSTPQWQIAAGEVWVDIAGESAATLTLTYAKVASLLRDGVAQLRCVARLNGEVVDESDAVAVTVDFTDVNTAVGGSGPVVISGAQVINGPFITAPVSTPTVSTPSFNAPSFNAGSAASSGSASTFGFAVGNPDPVPGESRSYTATYDLGTVAEPAATTAPVNYYVYVKYVLHSNGTTVADPYTAQLAAGSNFSATVSHPKVLGYLPYIVKDGSLEAESTTSLQINITDIQEDVFYEVHYLPTNVDYTVIHYQQNVDNDEYTEVERITHQGLTGSYVATGDNPEVAKTYPGFYALLYEKPQIAADGSTVVEIYYDRYYYLMNFELDGGYGVEPIYDRFGTPVSIGTPTKTGFTFDGWSPAVPSTIPVDGGTYTAIWTDPNTVNYTVVYWRENANDDGYSYWGSEIKQATAGSYVDGADTVPDSITTTTVDGQQLNERKHFTYNAGKTDKHVYIEGNGSSVVNVYYYRNVYSVYFRGISGTCAIPEHTHSDACASVLGCGKDEHTHTADCLVCTKGDHTHEEDCYAFTCTQGEHSHTDACYSCDQTNHTHSSSCYPGVGTEASPVYPPDNPQNGQIYSGNAMGFIPFAYIYVNGQWYNYNGNSGNGTIVQPNCGQAENNHTHTDACLGCGQTEHKHSDYTGSCYTLICDEEAHTHQQSCYDCGETEHTHTDDCYRPCTQLEHTHNNQCNQNDDDNVIYVVTAKYEEDISDVWPTAADFPNITFRGWSINGSSTTSTSKRVNMTDDLCDTSDHYMYADARTGGSTTYLYYMFESFDQTSPANGNERIYRNGKYYDKSEAYYQVVNSNGNWNQKEIYGMAPVSNGVVESGDNVFLYYTRNRHTLTFQNIDTVTKTVSNIMFEQPLKDYKDGDDKLIREYVPPYPSTLEPDAYVFDGWYTTPKCYEGTEFDFSTATMPNSDLALYANWVPVSHKVEFYLTETDMNTGNKIGESHPDVTVPHGQKVGTVPAEPDNGDYEFVSWFYRDEQGVEKAFDFANMAVNRDMKVYARWSSNVLKVWTVYYKYEDENGVVVEIGKTETGSALAGVTKTFDAKGGTELYEGYQDGYFPLTKSHSMTMDIENDANNVFTFWYKKAPAVPYTVKYLDKETNEPLIPAKTVSNNTKAVVTENFVVVQGYMPDAYQKRLVVSAEEGANNEIIFWYTKDDKHAYYQITHYTQNLDGTTWSEYSSSQAPGDIGTRYTGQPVKIDGYTYKEIKYFVAGVEVTENITEDGVELTNKGLQISLYYVPNDYPYEVRHLEEGTGTPLAEADKGTAKYNSVVSGTPKDIPNYEPVAGEREIVIRIEESQTEAKLNIINIYYREKEVTLNYVAVGPEGSGSVNPGSETVKIKTGKAQGSTATPAEGFRFMGWYEDAECTVPVSAENLYGNKFTPTKADDALWTAKTWYAKFEYDLTDLTITKTYSGMDQNQSAQFTVTTSSDYSTTVIIPENGSVTITGLKVGDTVTVTENKPWVWRYAVTNNRTEGGITASFVLDPDAAKNTVTFTNNRTLTKWLSGENYAVNSMSDDGTMSVERGVGDAVDPKTPPAATN